MNQTAEHIERVKKLLENSIFPLDHFLEEPRRFKEFISFPDEPNAKTFHETTYKRYPLGCYRLNDMMLIGAHALFSTPDKRLLKEQNTETIIEHSYTYLTVGARTDKPLELDSVVSLVSAPSYNFYHWTIDSLPKVLVAERCGFKGTYIIPARIMNKYAAQTLAIFDIDPGRIVPMEYALVTAKDLWIPTHFHGNHMHDTPILHRMFRQRVLDKISLSLPQKINRMFIKRKLGLGVRVILNQDQVDSVLNRYSITPLDMETYNVFEQIGLASQASVLIGPHGAGILHSLWMPNGSTVIEMLPINYQNPCMQVHSRLLGHKYYPYLVENSDDKLRLTVDCESFEKQLVEAGLRTH